MGSDEGDQPGFNVLFVCTGNICRSAFAEVLSRQLLLDRLGPHAAKAVEFSSAGIRAVAGAGMHPQTRNALAMWGDPLYDRAGAFRSRQLQPHMIRWADLIVTAEEAHRSQIAWTTPEIQPKLFTMLRFARILHDITPLELPVGPAERGRALVAEAAAARGRYGAEPNADSVPDPVGGSDQQHQRAADLIFDAVGTLVDAVAPRR